MDIKRTIIMLRQAKGELEAAIRQLEDGLIPGAKFSLDDAVECIEMARQDLKES